MKDIVNYILEAAQEKEWLDLKEIFKEYFERYEAIQTLDSDKLKKYLDQQHKLEDERSHNEKYYNYESDMFGKSWYKWNDKDWLEMQDKIEEILNKRKDEIKKLDEEFLPQVSKLKIRKNLLDVTHWTYKKGNFYPSVKSSNDPDPTLHDLFNSYEQAKGEYFENQRIAKETKEAKKEFKDINKIIPKSWQFLYDPKTKIGVYKFDGKSSWGHPQHTNLEKLIGKLESIGWKLVDKKDHMQPDDSGFSKTKIYMSPDEKFQLVQYYEDGNYGENYHSATISKTK